MQSKLEGHYLRAAYLFYLKMFYTCVSCTTEYFTSGPTKTKKDAV